MQSWFELKAMYLHAASPLHCGSLYYIKWLQTSLPPCARWPAERSSWIWTLAFCKSASAGPGTENVWKQISVCPTMSIRVSQKSIDNRCATAWHASRQCFTLLPINPCAWSKFEGAKPVVVWKVCVSKPPKVDSNIVDDLRHWPLQPRTSRCTHYRSQIP